MSPAPSSRRRHSAGDALPSALRLTGADGTAELRVTPTRRLRLAKGSRLVLLVRARRPADGWASPLSGTRLVSVRMTTAKGV